MHVEYLVTLPVHNWVVAPSNKLIPSVYTGIEIESNKWGKFEAVKFSGPTYVAIRSAKHCYLTAFSHATDVDRLFQLEEFKDFLKTTNSEGETVAKPIEIFYSWWWSGWESDIRKSHCNIYPPLH